MEKSNNSAFYNLMIIEHRAGTRTTHGTSMLMMYSVQYNGNRIFCNTVLKTVKMHILARLRESRQMTMQLLYS